MDAIARLKFRSFERSGDFPKMASLLQAISLADEAGYWTSAEEIERDYQHLIHSVPEEDMLMVEDSAGTLVAYVRVGWELDGENRQVFSFPFNIHPEHRSNELMTYLLNWVEKRARLVAETTRGDSPSLLRVLVRNAENEGMFSEALEAQGFSAARLMYQMRRELSEPIDAAVLPDGLEVRPVLQGEYRTVYYALDEAFRDHWGYTPISEEVISQIEVSPQFMPHLWQVAWDGEQVAAGVLNYVDESANQNLGSNVGWTDPIFTRRPWRKRGLARALLLRSLLVFREMGLEAAMLGVDTQNANQALHLYESVGFRTVTKRVFYEKNILR